MDVTDSVVSVVEPDMPVKVALTELEPAVTAVAIPLALIVAAAVFDELQLTRPFKSWEALFANTPVALNCCEVPMMLAGFAGVTEIDARGETVSVTEPEMPPDVAIMAAEPADTAVTSPLLPGESLTAATPALAELQVAEVVKSRALLSE